jgi:hypothetical protein
MTGFTPDLGRLDDVDRRIAAAYLAAAIRSAGLAGARGPEAAAAAFVRELAAVARASGPLTVCVDLDAAGRTAAGQLLDDAHERARRDGMALRGPLRVACEWQRFARTARQETSGR